MAANSLCTLHYRESAENVTVLCRELDPIKKINQNVVGTKCSTTFFIKGGFHMRFFKIPNQIFDYPLSPKGFMVYSYLVSRMNAFQSVVISYQAISDACHMDPKTACSAINELISYKLVIKEHRYNIDGYSKNKYTLNKLSGRWFKVEYDAFKTNIKSTAFKVYCFIKKCMDAKYEEAFPSLTAISEGTHLSRSSVATAIKYLREYTFINRIKRHYKQTRAYRHNRYIKFRLNAKKKEVRSQKRTSFIQQFIFERCYLLIHIIKRVKKNVKTLLLFKGSPKIP